jgi:hypothetical protein
MLTQIGIIPYNKEMYEHSLAEAKKLLGNLNT